MEQNRKEEGQRLAKILLASLILRLQSEGTYMGGAANWAVEHLQDNLLDIDAARSEQVWNKMMREAITCDGKNDLAMAIACMFLLFAQKVNSQVAGYSYQIFWAGGYLQEHISTADVPMAYVKRVTGTE